MFLRGWAAAKEADPDRLVVMSIADHDFDRLSCGPRTDEQLGAALTFLMTWGRRAAQATPALGARSSTRVLHEGYPFTYLRGETHLVVVNPRREPASLADAALAGATPLLVSGAAVDGDTVSADGFGYGVSPCRDLLRPREVSPSRRRRPGTR